MEEKALYDALAANTSAKEAIGDSKLRVIAGELITQVRMSVTSWNSGSGAPAQVTVGALADLWSPFSVTHRLDCEGPLKCQWQPHVSNRGGCDPGFNASVPAKGHWVGESAVWTKTGRRWGCAF